MSSILFSFMYVWLWLRFINSIYTFVAGVESVEIFSWYPTKAQIVLFTYSENISYLLAIRAKQFNWIKVCTSATWTKLSHLQPSQKTFRVIKVTTSSLSVYTSWVKTNTTHLILDLYGFLQRGTLLIYKPKVKIKLRLIYFMSFHKPFPPSPLLLSLTHLYNILFRVYLHKTLSLSLELIPFWVLTWLFILWRIVPWTQTIFNLQYDWDHYENNQPCDYHRFNGRSQIVLSFPEFWNTLLKISFIGIEIANLYQTLLLTELKSSLLATAVSISNADGLLATMKFCTTLTGGEVTYFFSLIIGGLTH